MQQDDNQKQARAALEKAICFYGRDSEGYYYFAKQQENLMMRYSVKDLANKNVLRSIAHEHLWHSAFSITEEREGKPPLTKMCWDAASGWVIQTFDGSRKMYSDSRLRGLGAWKDEDRFVVHLGNKLIVVSESENTLEPIKIEELDTTYTYMRLSNPINLSDKQTLTVEESNQIIKAFELFPWERPDLDPILLAGEVFLMPISGALDWRPHIWINGMAGTGKSTLWGLIKNLLVVFSQGFQSPKTTEAAIRQSVKTNAIPILFDEAEGRNIEEKRNMQRVIELARASSKESGAPIVKGSASQEAVTFNIRSMWIMSSIANSLEEVQDKERFTVLRFKKEEQNIKRYHEEILPLFTFFNEEFASRLFNRSVYSIIKVRHCIQVLSQALVGRLKSNRELEHYSTLLSGYWMLTHNDVITKEQAMNLINKFEFFKPLSEKPAPEDLSPLTHELISHLLTSQIEVQSSDTGARRKLSIGEIIESLQNQFDKEKENALKRHGLSWDFGKGLFIRNKHKELARIFTEANVPQDWKNIFKEIPGALSLKKNLLGTGNQYGILIPINSFNEILSGSTEPQQTGLRIDNNDSRDTEDDW